MDRRSEELRRISEDLRKFLAQQCPRTGDGYNDFVGESCDAAFQMLQDALRRMNEKETATEKGA